ncbi:hypothetical protein GCM10023238_36640 [Streptomyces heliomycini]
MWLRHTVTGADRERARRAAARLEDSLVLRTAPLDRTHVCCWTGSAPPRGPSRRLPVLPRTASG